MLVKGFAFIFYLAIMIKRARTSITNWKTAHYIQSSWIMLIQDGDQRYTFINVHSSITGKSVEWLTKQQRNIDRNTRYFVKVVFGIFLLLGWKYQYFFRRENDDFFANHGILNISTFCVIGSLK